MTDERRWTITPNGDEIDIRGPKFTEPVVVVPVSSVVPITRLREAIERAVIETEDDGKSDLLRAIRAALDDVECASNPNNERTNDA